MPLENNSVFMPSEATVGAAEMALTRHFKDTEPYPQRLVLNFKNSRFIEVSTLMVVIALVSDRVTRHLKTEISLPEYKPVRDFMRLWNFPEAIAKATGRPFSSLVCAEDIVYFGENKNHSDMTYKSQIDDPSLKIDDSSLVRLISDRFFGFITFTPSQLSRTRLVTEESKRWEKELIKSVLAKHLDGPEGYMASRVVYESMTNAVRHPNANIIQTSSVFTAPPKPTHGKYGHFTISFWDDGNSMIDTLFSAITNDKSVRSMETPNLYSKHAVVLKDHFGVKQREFTVSSGYLPTTESKEYEILFAATFPGITSDAAGNEHKVHENLIKDNPEFSIPGMGLHVLLNTAIDIYGGSVAFRTKNYFMNVRKAKKRNNVDYRAKIQYFNEEYFPPFKGNLVTVRLPLKKQSPHKI